MVHYQVRYKHQDASEWSNWQNDSMPSLREGFEEVLRAGFTISKTWNDGFSTEWRIK